MIAVFVFEKTLKIRCGHSSDEFSLSILKQRYYAIKMCISEAFNKNNILLLDTLCPYLLRTF